MIYFLKFTLEADKQIVQIKKIGDKVILDKISTLLKELKIHPYKGIGKPKPLRGNYKGYWSRRITQKHRLIYTVKEAEVLVTVVSLEGHYGDK